MSTAKETSMRLLKAVMAACLALFMSLPVAAFSAGKAYADDAAVREVASGVMKFNWHIDGDEYSRGSCFLINNDTVLTAYHCTMFSANELDRFGYSGKKLQELRDRMTYSVTINRDVKVGATLVNASEEQDFAIFKLDQPINNHTLLKIRDSSTVKPAETVYTVGFPANSDLKVINTYTADDVTFKSGVINKAEGIYQGLTSDLFNINGYYLQTDSVISGGDSGGPVVDADGNVIGISVAASDNYYLAVASDKVTPVLDDLGITWTAANGTTSSVGSTGSTSSSSSSSSAAEKTYELSYDKIDAAIKSADDIVADTSKKYTDDTYKKFTDALAAAKNARSSVTLEDNTDKDAYDAAKKELDEAATALTDAQQGLTPQPEGLPIGAIIGIIVAVVAIIAIVIVLVMRSRKKKEQQQAPTVPLGTPAGAPQQGGAQSWSKPAQPAIPTATAAAAGAALGAAAGAAATDVSETTILDDEASDTVILFQAASGGSLTRMSTNEQIPINSAEFTIGRERSKVNYCLEGNSSISRIHARLVVRDGKTFLIDNKAANGTFVNGVKARPGQEIQLKSGDIITLADEKFKYNA